MKFTMRFLAFTLLFSATSILSMQQMDALRKETHNLEEIIQQYQKTQDPDQQFWREWYSSTTNNLSLIYSLTQRTHIEYLGPAIKSLCCLPATKDDLPATQVNHSIINYRNKTLEIIKEYQHALYIRAESEHAEARAQRLLAQPNGPRCLTDYF